MTKGFRFAVPSLGDSLSREGVFHPFTGAGSHKAADIAREPQRGSTYTLFKKSSVVANAVRDAVPQITGNVGRQKKILIPRELHVDSEIYDGAEESPTPGLKS